MSLLQFVFIIARTLYACKYLAGGDDYFDLHFTIEPCLNVQLKDIISGRYKNVTHTEYDAHVENSKGEWVRKGMYICAAYINIKSQQGFVMSKQQPS